MGKKLWKKLLKNEISKFRIFSYLSYICEFFNNAGFLKIVLMLIRPLHVSDEIGHLLKEQDDFENLPEIMKDVVKK